MNNVIARKIDLTAGYQSLSQVQLIATITLSSPPTNTETVYLKGDLGDDIPLVPGEWHIFHSVDLAKIEVKGTAGNVVTIIGGTW